MSDNHNRENSLASSIALLPELERQKAINSLSQREAEALLYDWEFFARPKQLPPIWNWYIWLLLCGRGGGKTRTGAELTVRWAKEGFSPIALVGQTKADVRDTMVEVGDSAILNVSPPWFRPEYESSKRRLTFPNGVLAIIYSGDEPDQLRGPQHKKAWADELAKFKYPQEAWDNLMFGLRIGDKPQCVVTTTPRPIKVIKDLVADSRTAVTRGHTLENKDNLAPDFLKYIIAKYEGTRLGRQELAGEILDDNPEALWQRDCIDELRVRQHPDLTRVVVAIDPQGTDSPESAETGIVVAGIGEIAGKMHGYILADLTIKSTPDKWANAGVTGYYNFKADRIVGEVNNGGDMVEHTVRTVDKNVPFKSVHASRGKYTRAEPVSALYEQGRVHHVGFFPDLEDQLCEWVPGDKSPDRLDACFVAGTMIKMKRGEVPIERIKPGMLVETRAGLRQVLHAGKTKAVANVITAHFSDGHYLTGTPMHPIYVKDKGFTPLNSLVWSDIIEVWKEKRLNSTVLHLSDILKQKTGITGFTSIRQLVGIHPLVCSIKRFGKRIMERFQQAILSIIKMVIPSTMIPGISNVSLMPSMLNFTKRSSANNADSTLLEYAHLQRRGMLLLKVGDGIVNMVRKLGRIVNQSPEFVFSVGKNILASLIGIRIDSVPELAFQGGMRAISGIMRIEPVSSVGSPSISKNQSLNKPAPVSVLGLFGAGKAPVYNLQVEDASEYYANGILVHNCVWALTELMLGEEKLVRFG